MFFLNLEIYGVTRELWTYFTVKDILNLFITSKDYNSLCLRINNVIPQLISVKLFETNPKTRNGKIIVETENALKLQKLLYQFPNISKLYLIGTIGISLLTLNVENILYQSLETLVAEISCDEALFGISKFVKIKYLDLSESKITSKGLLKVSLLKNINTLKLRNCTNIAGGLRRNPKILNQLVSSLTNLTDLDMYSMTIIDLKPLGKLISLTSLNLSKCYYITDFSPLSTLLNLLCLQLNACNLIDSQLFFIKFLTKLKSLQISSE
jgi:hypothetical protein